MPPHVAALLVWGLVIVLLLRERRRFRDVLPGLWVPTLWLLILGSRAPSYWFSSGSAEMGVEAYEDGNSFNQVVYLSIIAIGIAVLLYRRVKWGDLIRRNRGLFLFLGYCAISFIWAEYPMVAVKGSIKALLGNLVMVLIVMTDPKPFEAIQALIRRCAVVLIPLSVLVIKYFPLIGRTTHHYTYETMYQGVATGGNGLAATCYVCGLLVIWNLTRRRATADKGEFCLDLALLGAIIWLLDKGDGQTALLSMIVGVVLLIMLERGIFRSAPRAIARYMGVVLLLMTPILVIGHAPAIALVGAIAGHSETLWGRFQLWQLVISMSGNPWLGLGYGNFWLGDRLQALWNVYSWHPTEAHSGYVETYLNLGLLGLGALGVFIASACRKAANADLIPELNVLKIAYLLPFILYNLTEAAFKGLHIVFFTFLLLAVETSQQMRSEARAAPDETRAGSIPNPRLRVVAAGPSRVSSGWYENLRTPGRAEPRVSGRARETIRRVGRP